MVDLLHAIMATPFVANVSSLFRQTSDKCIKTTQTLLSTSAKKEKKKKKKINVLCRRTNRHWNNRKLTCLSSSRFRCPFTACTWFVIWQACLVSGITQRSINLIKQDETGEIGRRQGDSSQSRPPDQYTSTWV